METLIRNFKIFELTEDPLNEREKKIYDEIIKYFENIDHQIECAGRLITSYNGFGKLMIYHTINKHLIIYENLLLDIMKIINKFNTLCHKKRDIIKILPMFINISGIVFDKIDYR